MKVVDFGFVAAEVSKKNVKRLRMRVSEDGTLKVTAPLRTPEDAIAAFVTKNERWILNNVERRKKQSACGFPDFSDDVFSLWGVTYPVVYENGAEGKAEVFGNVLRVTYPFLTENPRGTVILSVEKLLYRELTQRLRQRLPFWEDKTGLRSASVSIRKMETRWGSCTTSSRRIRIALNLAKKPPQCLDMVIVHELGHLVYPHHDTEFYQYMDKFYPDWKQAKRLLNKS